MRCRAVRGVTRGWRSGRARACGDAMPPSNGYTHAVSRVHRARRKRAPYMRFLCMAIPRNCLGLRRVRRVTAWRAWQPLPQPRGRCGARSARRPPEACCRPGVALPPLGAQGAARTTLWVDPRPWCRGAGRAAAMAAPRERSGTLAGEHTSPSLRRAPSVPPVSPTPSPRSPSWRLLPSPVRSCPLLRRPSGLGC